ncbi:Uncharacterized protein PHSC3_000528 [Chlamydiales bacterium STE3]|nr:Uncharacterized protein PHSC3_000528 [Chlamydiales bacterium STE3]
MAPEIQEKLMALANTAWVAVLFIFIAYRLNFFNQKKEGVFAKLNYQDVLGAFTIFGMVQLLVVPVFALLYLKFFYHDILLDPANLREETQAWIGIWGNLLLLSVIGWYSYLNWQKVSSFFGYEFQPRNFFLGAATWLVCMPIASTVGEMINLVLGFFRETAVDQMPVQHLKQMSAHPSLFFILAFIIIFVVPFVEELLFRGFLQTWLKQHMGLKGAILFTSAIFALFHFSWGQGLDNILFLSILFIVSCFMGFVYDRQKDLLASIGLHTAFNAVTTLSIFLGYT